MFFSWLWWLDTVLFTWSKGISRYHSILLCICKPQSTNLIHQRFYHTPTTMFALCLPSWGRFLHNTLVPTCTPLLKGYTVYGIRHAGIPYLQKAIPKQMFQGVFLLNNLYLYCHFVVISKLKQLHNSSAIKPAEI